MELEKEGMGLRRTLESEKGEKGDIMKKLKDLTTKIREITDENEKHKVSFSFQFITCHILYSN